MTSERPWWLIQKAVVLKEVFIGFKMSVNASRTKRCVQKLICEYFSLFLCIWQGCDLTKIKKSGKMGSRPGSPFGLEDKAPWTSWMFNFGGFTDSPHPHKQTKIWGLDTIQATSFFPWLATSLLSRNLYRQRENCIKKNQEIRKNPEKSQAWYKNASCDSFECWNGSLADGWSIANMNLYSCVLVNDTSYGIPSLISSKLLDIICFFVGNYQWCTTQLIWYLSIISSWLKSSNYR